MVLADAGCTEEGLDLIEALHVGDKLSRYLIAGGLTDDIARLLEVPFEGCNC